MKILSSVLSVLGIAYLATIFSTYLRSSGWDASEAQPLCIFIWIVLSIAYGAAIESNI